MYGEISGKRYMRTSIISARNSNHDLLNPFLFNDTADTELVLFWIREVLLPNLPQKSVTVWDNASFHKSSQIRNLLEQAGHTMIFLPPYSSDLNPIEHKWQGLKQRLRKYWNTVADFYENLIDQVNAMTALSPVVQPSDVTDMSSLRWG